jgi:hypothetical protein
LLWGGGKDRGYTFFNEGKDSSTGHMTVNQTAVMVPTDSIDSLIGKKLIEPPNIIKIDVEGAELDVLHGARAAVREYSPIIFIAIDNHDNKDYIYDFLKDMGYVIDCLNNNPYEIRALKEN